MGFRIIDVVNNWLLVLFDWWSSGWWLPTVDDDVSKSGLLTLFTVGLLTPGCSGFAVIFALAALVTVLFDSDVT